MPKGKTDMQVSNASIDGRQGDRIPPYSEEAERGVLGSILIDVNGHALVETLQRGLGPDSFYVPAHRQVFEAILDLHRAQVVVDLLTVGEKMRASGVIDAVFLERLVDATPTAAHVTYYVEIMAKKEARRRQITIARELERQAYDDETPTEDAVAHAQEEMFRLLGTVDSPQTNNDAIMELRDEWYAAKDGRARGLPCFMPSVAKKLGLFKRGRLYVLGAPPGAGKTTWACNQMKYWAMGLGRCIKPHPVAMYSAEMTKADVLGINICEHADVSKFALDNAYAEEAHPKNGDHRPRIEKAIEAASLFVDPLTGADKVPLHVEDKFMNSEQVESWARMMKHRHGIEAIVVDHAQIQEPPPWFRGTSTERIAFVTHRYRALAKALDVVVLMLSHLTGEGAKGKKPTPDELFGGRVLQQDARAVIMLYTLDGQDYVDIQKNGGGTTAQIQATFNRSRQRWEDPITSEGADKPDQEAGPM